MSVQCWPGLGVSTFCIDWLIETEQSAVIGNDNSNANIDVINTEY